MSPLIFRGALYIMDFVRHPIAVFLIHSQAKISWSQDPQRLAPVLPCQSLSVNIHLSRHQSCDDQMQKHLIVPIAQHRTTWGQRFLPGFAPGRQIGQELLIRQGVEVEFLLAEHQQQLASSGLGALVRTGVANGPHRHSRRKLRSGWMRDSCGPSHRPQPRNGSRKLSGLAMVAEKPSRPRSRCS
jgi:hypothetical protein